ISKNLSGCDTQLDQNQRENQKLHGAKPASTIFETISARAGHREATTPPTKGSAALATLTIQTFQRASFSSRLTRRWICPKATVRSACPRKSALTPFSMPSSLISTDSESSVT